MQRLQFILLIPMNRIAISIMVTALLLGVAPAMSAYPSQLSEMIAKDDARYLMTACFMNGARFYRGGDKRRNDVDYVEKKGEECAEEMLLLFEQLKRQQQRERK